MKPLNASRRRLLLASLAAPLAGCGTPLPLVPPAADPDAQALLDETCQAHGLADYRRLRDISVAYEGQWRPLVGRIQPEVVDEAYRGPSQERLLPHQGIVAQAYTGPAGRKHVYWQRAPREVQVWVDGQPRRDEAALDAAALVAEGYGLFLLGPLWLAGRGLPLQRDGSERFDGRLHDRLQVWLRPGLGRVAEDRVTLLVDRRTRVTHRLRFTLEGAAGTRGAVAQVDTYEHERRGGVLWPMRSYEEVVHPIRLPAHDWRIAGLDLDRGFDAAALRGPAFTGAAAAPAGVRATSAAA